MPANVKCVFKDEQQASSFLTTFAFQTRGSTRKVRISVFLPFVTGSVKHQHKYETFCTLIVVAFGWLVVTACSFLSFFNHTKRLRRC